MIETQSDKPWADQESQEELRAGLAHIGESLDLVMLVMKTEAVFTVGLSSQALVLPTRFAESGIFGGLGHELLASGLRESVAKLRPHGPTPLLAESLLSLARCTRGYVTLEESLELVLEAIDSLKASQAEHRLARAYLELAVVLKGGGDVYDALSALEHCIHHARRHRDAGALSAAYYETGTICRRVGAPVSALDYFARSRISLPQEGDMSIWLERIASEEVACQLPLGRESEALSGISEWIGRGASVYQPSMYRGDIHLHHGRQDQALDDYIDGCVVAGKTIRERMSDRYRRLDTRRAEEIFDRGILIALELGRAEDAFGLVELANAGPTAFLPEGGGAGGPSPADAQTAAAQIGDLLDRALDAASSGDEARLRACQEEADWLIAQADILRDKREDIAVSRALVHDWAATLQAALSPEDGLLQFVEVGDRLVAFCVTSKRLVAATTGLSPIEARLLARGAIHEIRGRFETPALRELGCRLLEPVAELLDEVSTLTVIPSPAIHGLPFHALTHGAAPLISSHRIQYDISAKGALRASVGAVAVSRDARWTGLGAREVGYARASPLDQVQAELSRAATHFEAPRCIVDPPAAAQDLFDAMSSSDVTHLACHGVFEPNAPLLSRLLLHDRPVFAFEVVLRRSARGLVVLSACDTARAQSDSGGYVQSLASAFMSGGARSLIATLWPLYDQAAMQAMERFYDDLLAPGGQAPAAALQRAQQELMAENPHPYFWASFAAFAGGGSA